jgi:Type II secretion system (T2SS), protein K
MKLFRKSKIRGAALMLSLWALFLLSAVVISWAMDIDSRISLSGNANRALEAEAMACSGTEIALHPAVKAGSSVLKGNFGKNQGYEVRITGEGGRLNLNWLLAGENPARLEVLRKYLELKGIDLNERDHMIDCLLDWVDQDNLVRLNGAEADGDYQPANELLTRIDDLKKVKGWTDFTATSDWQDDFTLNSTGPIDIVWASRTVLLALPGMTELLVDRFLAARQGPDKIDGTIDDLKLQTLDEVRVAFGLLPEQFGEISPMIGFKDPVLRITSTGKSAQVTRVVQMVVRKTGDVAQLITWKEI